MTVIMDAKPLFNEIKDEIKSGVNSLKNKGRRSAEIIKKWTPLNSARIMNEAVQMVIKK